MYVIKRDGRREDCHFDKITARIRKLCYGLDPMLIFQNCNNSNYLCVLIVNQVCGCYTHLSEGDSRCIPWCDHLRVGWTGCTDCCKLCYQTSRLFHLGFYHISHRGNEVIYHFTNPLFIPSSLTIINFIGTSHLYAKILNFMSNFQLFSNL